MKPLFVVNIRYWPALRLHIAEDLDDLIDESLGKGTASTITVDPKDYTPVETIDYKGKIIYERVKHYGK